MSAKAPVPVEHKVVWSTLASAAVSIALAVLNGLSTNAGALESLGIPKEYQTLILGLVPPLLVFLGGYKAAHTTRPDEAVAAAPSADTVAGADDVQARDAAGRFTADPA